MPTTFHNPSTIRWNSGRSWSNGQQRTLLKNNDIDPYDQNVSISQGERRKLFITGYNNAYHSGDRSRVNFRVNAYNALVSFFVTWKTGITSLSIRLRSRIDEVDPTTNRFGGYVAKISSSQVAWYKLDYAGGTYTALSPATSTISPALVNGDRTGIRFVVYSNAANTQTILKMYISRPDTEQSKPLISALDSSPASHLLDADLYNMKSYAHIKLNGTVKDVKYEGIQIWNLGDKYYLRSILEKGEMTKTLITRFDVEGAA